MNQGDYVTRKSYGNDILFKIEYIDQERAILRGVEFRLLADSPLHDLVPVKHFELEEHASSHAKNHGPMRLLAQSRELQIENNLRELSEQNEDIHSYFEVPGMVLHLDGDAAYLRKSVDMYNQLRVPAEGYYVEEANMSEALYQLLPQVKPDIVVITGHDGMLKLRVDERRGLDEYKNSHNFVKAVRAARQYERNRDTLTIIAGACQSHFEALLRAGANYASSPGRILIHALDPVHVAAKISYTSIKETINLADVISHTVSGIKGIGGIESKGSYRMGLPNLTG